jgi:hypothetical protein
MFPRGRRTEVVVRKMASEVLTAAMIPENH